LFKKLITTFFPEFMALFLPDADTLADYSDLRFLSQELMTDLAGSEKHYVDILAELKFKGEAGYVLVHVEPQAQRSADFARRMFSYFIRLHERHQRKVIPIAIFSHDSRADEPTRYEVAFPFLTVLRFEFWKVQLKQISWQQYLESGNPLAAALLSKLSYQPSERLAVRLEFLRQLARMQLDPARIELVTTFFDSYLELTAEEERLLEERLPEELAVGEVKRVVEITTSWHRKGRQEGIQEGIQQGLQKGLRDGRQELLFQLLRKRLGSLSSELEARIAALSAEQFDRLAERLFDITSEEQVERFLATN
jgi:predicted transposase YdaD